MKVHAKRLGWNEKLTEDQKWDLDEYEHDSDDLEGELVVFLSRIGYVYLVGGQEADPNTVK